MPTAAAETLPVRLVVVSPPVGVVFAVQIGRAELLPPARTTDGALFFEFSILLATRRGAGDAAAPVFRGPAVQGRLDDLFIYVNSGVRAGDTASPWERRAKIRLAGLAPALLATWRAANATQSHFLAARFAGCARDGGPVCASITLLDGGWRIETVGGAEEAQPLA